MRGGPGKLHSSPEAPPSFGASPPWFSVRSIACKLALLAASLAIIPIFRHQPWIVALDAVVLAVVFGQLGFQLHDAGHRQMFRTGRLNALVGLMTGDLLVGMSYAWWVDKRNRHHANRVREANVIVRQFCEERGIPYRQTSIFRSYLEILGHLHDVGSTVQRKRSIEPHSA